MKAQSFLNTHIEIRNKTTQIKRSKKKNNVSLQGENICKQLLVA